MSTPRPAGRPKHFCTEANQMSALMYFRLSPPSAAGGVHGQQGAAQAVVEVQDKALAELGGGAGFVLGDAHQVGFLGRRGGRPCRAVRRVRSGCRCWRAAGPGRTSATSPQNRRCRGGELLRGVRLWARISQHSVAELVNRTVKSCGTLSLVLRSVTACRTRLVTFSLRCGAESQPSSKASVRYWRTAGYTAEGPGLKVYIGAKVGIRPEIRRVWAADLRTTAGPGGSFRAQTH